MRSRVLRVHCLSILAHNEKGGSLHSIPSLHFVWRLASGISFSFYLLEWFGVPSQFRSTKLRWGLRGFKPRRT